MTTRPLARADRPRASNVLLTRIAGFNMRTVGRVLIVRPLAHITMKRHILLALFRVLLAPGVVYALPFSHIKWGERYPGDGQQAFGFIIMFFVVGFAAAAVFIGLGSLGQFLFRKRPARFTVFTDLALFLVFAGVLTYGGVTARYEDTQPDKSPKPNAVARPLPKSRFTFFAPP
jgi:hypothetical protein